MHEYFPRAAQAVDTLWQAGRVKVQVGTNLAARPLVRDVMGVEQMCKKEWVECAVWSVVGARSEY